jgi:iron complex transport system ATP-binding protein
MLRIEDLSFAYNSRVVLKGIDFDVTSGEMLFIIGPNGSGKSTLLKCLNGILKPRGSVYIGMRELNKLPRGEIAKWIGYVPQRGEINHLTVFDTILLGRKPHIKWSVSENDTEVVKRIIKLLDLEDLSFRRLTELSGGELQKVIIARALAQEPKILLLDEPTNNLDLKNQIEVMRILRKVVRERGISAVITMHDLNIASLYADRIIMLKDGEIVSVGGVEVLNSENIEKVYGIKVSVVEHDGKPLIVFS